jgi:hypothetical protein
MTRHEPLYGREARELEALLGLRPYSLRAVERRANGDFAIRFKAQLVGDRGRRVLRIPARLAFGYVQRSPSARPRDVRYRRRAADRKFALWLMRRLDYSAPILRAIYDHDLDVIEELRELMFALTPPDYVVAVWQRPRRRETPLYVPEDWCA